MSSKDHLAAVFKWSHIINQHLKSVIWEIQQYVELMAEFKEQNIYSAKLYTKMVTVMVIHLEDAEDSKNPLMYHRCLCLIATPFCKKHHPHLPLTETSLKFTPLFLTLKLMKHHRTLLPRDADINIEWS